MQGVYSVLPTPFAPDGSFDSESLRRVIDLFLEDGVSGFTALGVTSEVARISDRERDEILEASMAHADGRAPVIVGATGPGLDVCLERCRAAERAGAAGVMVSPPRAPKCNSEAIFRHFARIAETISIPVVIQDFPPISGFHMEPDLLARICRRSRRRAPSSSRTRPRPTRRRASGNTPKGSTSASSAASGAPT